MTSSIHALTAFGLLWAGTASSLAQSADSQVLDAMRGAPALTLANAEREAAIARAQQITVGEYETNLETGFARRHVDTDGDSVEWQVGLSRRFRWPQKRLLDYEMARTSLALADARYESAWHQAALEWASLWVRWKRARDLQGILARRVEDARSRHGLERERIAQGRGRIIDLDRLERDLALLNGQLGAAEQETELARLALEAIYPGTAELELVNLTRADECAVDMENWQSVAAALERAPSLRATRLSLQQAELARVRANYDRRADPQVGLQVFSERNGRETGLGVSLSMPISGGLRTARVHEADADRTIRMAELDAAEAATRQLALELSARLVRLDFQLDQARMAVDAASQVLDRLATGQALQAVTQLEVLEARESLWEAREAEARIEASHLGTRLELGIRLGCILQVE